MRNYCKNEEKPLRHTHKVLWEKGSGRSTLSGEKCGQTSSQQLNITVLVVIGVIIPKYDFAQGVIIPVLDILKCPRGNNHRVGRFLLSTNYYSYIKSYESMGLRVTFGSTSFPQIRSMRISHRRITPPP